MSEPKRFTADGKPRFRPATWDDIATWGQVTLTGSQAEYLRRYTVRKSQVESQEQDPASPSSEHQEDPSDSTSR